MISKHTNYLLQFDLICCCLFTSGVITCIIFNTYVHLCVEGDFAAKTVFTILMGASTGMGFFLTALMNVFYIAIQIKFLVLNEHFK